MYHPRPMSPRSPLENYWSTTGGGAADNVHMQPAAVDYAYHQSQSMQIMQQQHHASNYQQQSAMPAPPKNQKMFREFNFEQQFFGGQHQIHDSPPSQFRNTTSSNLFPQGANHQQQQLATKVERPSDQINNETSPQ